MAVQIPVITKFDATGLKQAQKQVGGFAAKIKGGLKIAGATAAVAASLAFVAQRFAKMAEQAEIANNRLDQVAASMGTFGDQTFQVTDRLKAYADANKFILGADDEVIKSTQSKLLTFKNLAATADEAGGSFDRATQAAFDMAAAGFGSAESQAIKLGRALQDPVKNVNALSRSGVQFTESQKAFIKSLVDSGKQLEAQDFILSEIESRVGGTAAATVTASKKMEIAFGEIGEAIGSSVLPLFESFANWLVEVTPDIEAFFKGLTDPTTEVGQKWFEMSGAVIAFGDTIASVWGQIDGSAIFNSLLDLMETVLIGLSQIVWVAGDAGKTLGMLFSGDFAGAGEQFSTFFSRYNGFVTQLYNKIDTSAKKLAADAQKRFEPTVRTPGPGSDANDAAKAAAKKARDEYKAEIKERKKALKEFRTEMAGLATSFQPLLLAGRELGEFEQSVVDSLGSMTEAIQKAVANKAITKAAAASLTDYAKREATLLAGIAQKRDELAKRRELASALIGEVKDAIKSTGNLVDLFGKLTDKAADNTQNNMTKIVEQTVKAGRSLKDFRVTIISSMVDPLNQAATTGAGGLIQSLKDVVTRTIAFRQNLKQLRALGLNQDLFKQIVDAGEETGGETAKAILAGGPEAIKELNSLFGTLNTVGADIAEETAQVMYGAGVDVSNGLINGLLSMDEQLRITGETLANSFVNAFNAAMAGLSIPTADLAMPTKVAAGKRAGAKTGGTTVNVNVKVPPGQGTKAGKDIVKEVTKYAQKSGGALVRGVATI